MDPLTTAWTDRHGRVALLVVAVAGSLLAGLREEWQVTAVVALAVLVASTVALVLDQFGGLVVGIGAAALLTAGRRAADLWTPEDFPLALTQVVAVVLTGWLAGRVGVALRETEDGGTPTAAAPAFGSLGLLDMDTAMLRLDEEVERARTHDRDLTLVLLRVEVRDTSLDEAAVAGAQRAVARLVESRVREADVPFAAAHGEFGVLLPETSAIEALEPVARILDGVTTGRFAVRGQGRERQLADTVEVTVGTATFDDATSTAGALVDAAMAALGRAPRATRPPVPWLS